MESSTFSLYLSIQGRCLRVIGVLLTREVGIDVLESGLWMLKKMIITRCQHGSQRTRPTDQHYLHLQQGHKRDR